MNAGCQLFREEKRQTYISVAAGFLPLHADLFPQEK